MFATKRIALWAALFVGTMAICACNDGDKTISKDDGFENNGGDKGNAGNSGNTGNTGNTGNSGNTGNTDNTGNSGNSGNSGNTGGGTQTGSDSCEGVDLKTSNAHCGACNHACNEYSQCVDGECTCAEGNSDCNGDGICDTYGECICAPGETLQCYFGDEAEIGRGECKAGVFECKKGIDGNYRWGSECVGMVMPSYDYVCDPSRPDLDLDCNGIPDAEQDEDGDGYAICKKVIAENGEEQLVPDDCCDNIHMCNTDHPELVHPGAIECKGNGIDDNCDGEIDNTDYICGTEMTVIADCEMKNRSCSNLANWKYNDRQNTFTETGLREIANALDMCLDNIGSHETPDEGGIIEIKVLQSGLATNPDPRQVNVVDGMYDVNGVKRIAPREGNSFIILSSGIAADAKNMERQGDLHIGGGHKIPEPYYSAHNEHLQSHKDCGSSDSINDSVHLHIKMRAPKNAQGFSFDFRFFSREYPYYVCSQFNDFFLTLLTDESGKPLAGVNPDGNISFDKAGNPVSVNNAFFTTCANPKCRLPFTSSQNGCPAVMACDPNANTCGTGCVDGSDDLAAYYPDYYASSNDDTRRKRGGGTAWLTTQAPVVPGQIFNLDFYIWDTSDQVLDSSVIIDNFQWKCTETQVSTDFATGGGKVN